MDILLNTLSVVRYNIKITFRINVIAALALVLLAPFIFSLTLLTDAEMSGIGELYLSITGILLLIYIGRIEEREEASEAVYIRKTPHAGIFILRIAIMSAVIFIMVGAIVLLAVSKGSNIDFWKITGGVWVSAVFFGILGLTVVNITKELAAGYLVSFAYYSFEFFTRGKYTQDFFVLSLLKNSFDEKYRILALILLMLAGNFIYLYRKS